MYFVVVVKTQPREILNSFDRGIKTEYNEHIAYKWSRDIILLWAKLGNVIVVFKLL